MTTGSQIKQLCPEQATSYCGRILISKCQNSLKSYNPIFRKLFAESEISSYDSVTIIRVWITPFFFVLFMTTMFSVTLNTGMQRIQLVTDSTFGIFPSFFLKFSLLATETVCKSLVKTEWIRYSNSCIIRQY